MNKDGQLLDVDIVLNELCQDGSELHVEYSDGPLAYRARWDGRPSTPPFKWGEGGEELPPHDAWLTELDLKTEGGGVLLSKLHPEQDPSSGMEDLARVKEILVKYAGALQATFLYYECDGQKNPDTIGRMIMTQFRTLMQAAKVITPRFPYEKVDEIFPNVATAARSLDRKVDALGASTFDLIDFFLAIVHVAFHRFLAENGEEAASTTSLSAMLDSLMDRCFAANIFPEFSKKMEKFYNAYTPGTELLLKKGRRLTEQTLDSCQLKRIRSYEVRVDLKYLCNHLTKWNLLLREFSFQELALLTIVAKQPQNEMENFILQPQPIELNYNEFEKLILCIAYHMYTMKKRHDPFEGFLGETLDSIYKRGGVLVEVSNEEVDM
ncbi:hypothetical protein BSKO_02969 [Bryopsis sp. KO-2023]|nr:hypothetical protein BSKO_02969 [Bryopsis sp. KO-2023]